MLDTHEVGGSSPLPPTNRAVTFNRHDDAPRTSGNEGHRQPWTGHPWSSPPDGRAEAARRIHPKHAQRQRARTPKAHNATRPPEDSLGGSPGVSLGVHVSVHFRVNAAHVSSGTGRARERDDAPEREADGASSSDTSPPAFSAGRGRRERRGDRLADRKDRSRRRQTRR